MYPTMPQEKLMGEFCPFWGPRVQEMFACIIFYIGVCMAANKCSELVLDWETLRASPEATRLHKTVNHVLSLWHHKEWQINLQAHSIA